MTKRIAALVASLALLGACKDSTSVSDLNNVSAETLKGGLNPATGQLLVTGLFNQYRNSAIGNYVVFPETMARDAYRIDKAEPRYISELIGSVQPDAGAFTGQGVFAGFFVGIRSANTLIAAVKNATDASGVNAAERSSLLGLARTMKALNYWNVMEMRDTVGMPIDLDQDINAPPAPWHCKQNVLAYVSALLDSAAADLGAASAAFPVTLPAGYRDFAGTPAKFLKFNRGIKAKVELYRGLSPSSQGGTGAAGFNNAIAALNASFMQTADVSAAGLAQGVYENYSTASGETANSLVDAALHLNPAVRDSLQAGDLRGAKIVQTAIDPATNQPKVYSMTVGTNTVATTYDYAFSLGSTSLTHALPILKNEELLLLRAQAAIELNDLVTARTYLNYVRQGAGGLAPYGVFTSQAQARSALLYEKRYSLLMEGPQRLVDLRAYGLLNGTNFRPGTVNSPITGDVFTSTLPIPINELNARGGTAPKTCS
jgi:hypothetical protein